MKKDYIYVGIQGILFVGFIFDFDYFTLSIPGLARSVGLGMAVLGGMIVILSIVQLSHSLSPFPTPRKNGQLISNGLFRLARHPIYSGIILGSLGLGLYLQSDWKIAISLTLLILFYFKSSYEEILLDAHYPDYKAYKQKTGRFVPKIR